MLSFKALSFISAFLCLAISPDFSFWGDGIKGSGTLVKQTRDLVPFEGVKITNHGDLYISLGKEIKLIIEVEDNLQEYIQAEVKNGILEIGTSKSLENLRPTKPMSYYLTVLEGQLNSLTATSHGDITCPALRNDSILIRSTSHGNINIDGIFANKIQLDLSSHGDLNIDNLEAKTLNITQSSHSNIRIKAGKVTKIDLDQTSHGNFKAFPVLAEEASINQTSHGQIEVSVSKQLHVRATSHGDVYYKGDPEEHIRADKNATVKRLK